MNQATDTTLAVKDPLFQPRAPHDDLTFGELATAYNFRNVSDRRLLLVRLIVKELAKRPGPTRTLDMGCGKGIGCGPDAVRYLRIICRHSDEPWGLEPDTTVQPPPGLFHHFQHATMESADLPKDSFDLIYSSLVMEHIANPRAVFAAAYRCLKPGGVFLFHTMNARHYFTRIASLAKRLKVDERALRLVRGQTVDTYHYPVQYRCNMPKQIMPPAMEVGFLPPTFAYVEIDGPRPYFKGPLRPILEVAMLKRRMWKNPQCLLNLYCRMAKPL